MTILDLIVFIGASMMAVLLFQRACALVDHLRAKTTIQRRLDRR